MKGELKALRAEGTIAVRDRPHRGRSRARAGASARPRSAATPDGHRRRRRVTIERQPAIRPTAATRTPAAPSVRTTGRAGRAAAGRWPPRHPSLIDSLALERTRHRAEQPRGARRRREARRRQGMSLGNLNMTLGGDLHATKRAGGRPLVVGSIHTVRGFYEFQGRSSSCSATAPSASRGRTRPTRSSTSRRRATSRASKRASASTARRSGPSSSCRARRRSTKPTSCRSSSSTVRSTSSDEGEKTTLAQRAGSLVGGFVAAPVAEALRDALDVDLLEITPVSEGGGGPEVSIGNQIGERVFVKVRQQFGSSEATQLVLEYELSKLLRLETSVAQGGDTSRTIGRRAERGGADLVFVIRY